LNFWEAQERARALARGDTASSTRPITVDEALNAYRENLIALGGQPMNADRVRCHLPKALLAKSVALLEAGELRRWRNGLISKGMKPATADRTMRSLKACLNLAARGDRRISNRDAWGDLERLPDSDVARDDQVLSEDQVRAVVRACWQIDPAF